MTHTIKSGETLSKIAKDNGLTLAQLLDANPQFKANPNDIKVGDQVTIPDGETAAAAPTEPAPVQPQPPAQPQPPPAATGHVLGKLSEKFETGGRGPGTVSGGQGDPGGASYGSYQMTSKPAPGTVGRFISQPDFPFRSSFTNLAPGSAEFTAVWKQLATSQRDAFQDSQHTFIKKTHFDPLVAKIKAEDQLDITTRSFTLQDVIWSTSVQHGGGSSIPHVALRAVTVSQGDPDFDKSLIIAIYAERGRKQNGVLAHFSKSSPAVQQGVANRFRSEQSDALKMLADEG
jgi:hypothetical protein